MRPDLGLSSITLTSGLGTLLEIVRQRIADLAVPILLVVFQIGAVTLAVLAGVGALALTRQGFELAVLHSRGFRRGVLLAAQAVQAVFAAIVAYPLGLLLGMGLAALASTANGPDLPGVSFPIRLNAAGEQLGLVAAVIGAIILIGLSIPYVSRTILEERRAASREDRPLLARVPVELFVLPLGVFAFLQLRTGTGPEAGSGEIDPLILVAPTLLLFGGSFLALRLLLLVFRGARLTDRPQPSPLALPGRQARRAIARDGLRRRPVAPALDGSPRRLDVVPSDRPAQPRGRGARAGRRGLADQRDAARGRPDRDPTSMPPLTTPVVRTDPRLEAGTFNLPPVALGIDPERHAAAAWWREDFSETPLPEIMQRLETPPFGMALPAPTSTLTMEIDSGAGRAEPADHGDRASTGTASCTRAPLQPVELGAATYELRPRRRRAPVLDHDLTGPRSTPPTR